MATRALTILKRVGLGVLALIGVLLVLGLTIGIPVPGWLVRDDIESALSQVLNHDFSLDGELSIRLSPNARIHVTDVRIADGDTDLVTAESVSASLKVSRLFSQDIVVNNVVATGIHILDFAAFTDVDVGGDDDDGDGAEIKLAFDTFTIRDSSLNWALAGNEWRLDIGELTGTAPLGQMLQGTLIGALRGLPVSMDLNAEELTPLINQRLPWPFAAKGTVSDNALEANAEIQVFSPYKMQIGFRLDAPGIGLFNHLFELPLPDPGKIGVAATFGFDEARGILSFGDIDGTVGQSDFRGQLDVDIGTDPPKLSGNIEGKRFVADDWIGGNDEGVDEGVDEGFNLDDTIAQITGVTKDLGIETSLRFSAIDAVGIHLATFDTQLKMTPGRLAAEDLSFTLGVSKASGELAFVDDAGERAIAGQITFPQFSLVDLPLLDSAKLPEAGVRDANLVFNLRGSDLPDIYQRSGMQLDTGAGKLEMGGGLTAGIGALSVKKKPGELTELNFSGTWRQTPARIAGTMRWNNDMLKVVVEPDLFNHHARITWSQKFNESTPPELYFDAQFVDATILQEAFAGTDDVSPVASDGDSPNAAAPVPDEAVTDHPVTGNYEPLQLPDLVLAGEIGELRVPGTSVKPLRWDGAIADNTLDLTLSATLSRFPILGTLQVASENDGFAIDAEFRTEEVSLPQLLGRDDVPDANIGEAIIEISTRGKDTTELLDNLTAMAEVRHVDLPLPESIPADHLHLDTGVFQIDETAVEFSMQGKVNEAPLDARLVSAPLSTILDEGTVFPLVFGGDIGDHHYRFEGHPDEKGVILMKVSASGPSLDAPAAPGTVPWLTSAYELEGQIEWSDQLLTVHDLELRVGSSRFIVDTRYDTARERPRLLLSFIIPRFDFRDFALPVSPAVVEDVKSKSVDEEGTITVQTEGKTPIMNALQGIHDRLPDIDISVFLMAELRDGPHDLGFVLLMLNSTAQGLAVDPLVFYLPEGELRLEASMDLTAPFFMSTFIAKAASFEYGIIVPLVSTDAQAEGLLDLDASIWMQGATLQDMRNNINGHIDVAVWPTGQSSEMIDAWTGSIFQIVMPVVQGVTGAVDTTTGTGVGSGTQSALDNVAGRQRGSVLNCIVMHPRFEHGVMKDDTVLLDTTGSVVHGRGEINFPENTIDFRLIPQAKVEKFFSIETPINIKGSLNDFSIGLVPGGLARMAIKFYYNIYYVVVKRLAGKHLPADGFETCYNNWMLNSKAAEEEKD